MFHLLVFAIQFYAFLSLSTNLLYILLSSFPVNFLHFLYMYIYVSFSHTPALSRSHILTCACTVYIISLFPLFTMIFACITFSHKVLSYSFIPFIFPSILPHTSLVVPILLYLDTSVMAVKVIFLLPSLATYFICPQLILYILWQSCLGCNLTCSFLSYVALKRYVYVCVCYVCMYVCL